jgi:chromosome segregation ATPase
MELLQSLATGAIGAGIVGGFFAIFQLILNKKLRSPADRQTEIKTVFEFLNGTIMENRADRVANETTIKTLREYAEKLENDARADQELIRELHAQIYVLEERNAQKDRRIRELEYELRRYASIIILPNTPNEPHIQQP